MRPGAAAGRARVAEDIDFNARFYRGLMRFGHRRWTRDITLVHRELVSSGQARWLGEPAAADGPSTNRDMERVL